MPAALLGMGCERRTEAVRFSRPLQTATVRLVRVRSLRDLGRVATVGAEAWTEVLQRRRRRQSQKPLPGWLAGAHRVTLWPALFATSLIFTAAGEVHLSADRNGTFTIYRRGPAFWCRLVLAVVLFGAALAGLLFVSSWAGPWGPVYAAGGILLITFGLFVFMVAGLALLWRLRTSGSAVKDVSRDTPKGARWSIGSLAQAPGTQWSALESAIGRIETLPAKSVIVAIARTPELQNVYVSRGKFERGEKLRVHRVIASQP